MVIVDGPQCADLGVLQHPGIEYYEQSHLLVQGLELENDLLGDKNTRTHAPQAVRTVRLHRSHRSDVFPGEDLQLIFRKWAALHNWRGCLHFVHRLISSQVVRQKRQAKSTRSRRSNSEEGNNSVPRL